MGDAWGTGKKGEVEDEVGENGCDGMRVLQ